MDLHRAAAAQSHKQHMRAAMLRESAKKRGVINKLRAQVRSQQAQRKISRQADWSKQKADAAKAVRQQAAQRARRRARLSSARAKRGSQRASARARARQAR